MSTDSSKIKKNISAIYFKGKRTVIHFTQKFQPAGQNEMVEETKIFKSNLGRHPEFERCMEKMKVHAVLRSLPMIKPDDITGKLIDQEWFNEHLYETHPNFMDAEVLGFIITTKNETTGFQVIYELTTVDEQKVKIKSGVINTLHQEGGYNYALRVLADEHKESLLLEAEEFLKYKSSNPQLRIAV